MKIWTDPEQLKVTIIFKSRAEAGKLRHMIAEHGTERETEHMKQVGIEFTNNLFAAVSWLAHPAQEIKEMEL